MKRDVIQKPLQSSFLSCEKDCEEILERLFIRAGNHSEELKKLLVINEKQCLDKDSKVYREALREMTLSKLREDGYIRLEPKVAFGEHEEVKSYILIGFDNFITNDTNPQYRDCTVTFDILCHTDCWDLGQFRLRPLKIAGYIDGIINNAKLSGIGTFQFLGCNELILDETLSGYTLMYRAIHGIDDKLDDREDIYQENYE